MSRGLCTKKAFEMVAGLMYGAGGEPRCCQICPARILVSVGHCTGEYGGWAPRHQTPDRGDPEAGTVVIGGGGSVGREGFKMAVGLFWMEPAGSQDEA